MVNQPVLSTPILIIAYRREETTRKVLEAVSKVKPKRLYVVCNAPHPDRPMESDQCQMVRKLFENLNWDCRVYRLFRDRHLTAKESIFNAISWFFEHESQGIILEDDCLPSTSFFRYASELLQRYENDQRIGMISGDNFQYGIKRGNASYYFSRYCHIWGWATWRDRWMGYDPAMLLWPSSRQRVLSELQNSLQRFYWKKIFDRTYSGCIDTWDYQWLFFNWINNRMTVLPQVNLVSNIGFGEQAHHTRNLTRASNLKAHELNFPLQHPIIFTPDRQADNYSFYSNYLPRLNAIMRFGFKAIHFWKIWEK